MSGSIIDPEVELVLFAFTDACPEATPSDVRTWSARFPQLEQLLVGQAKAMRIAGPYDNGETVDLTPGQTVAADVKAIDIFDATFR